VENQQILLTATTSNQAISARIKLTATDVSKQKQTTKTLVHLKKDKTKLYTGVNTALNT